MLRVLLLTSTLGIFARTCWAKELVGQIIALAFLIIFMYFRPYRSSRHAILSTVALATPVFSLGWALAGGWEVSHERRFQTTNEDAEEYDSIGVVILHGFIVVPPLCACIFTCNDILYMYM